MKYNSNQMWDCLDLVASLPNFSRMFQVFYVKTNCRLLPEKKMSSLKALGTCFHLIQVEMITKLRGLFISGWNVKIRVFLPIKPYEAWH